MCLKVEKDMIVLAKEFYSLETKIQECNNQSLIYLIRHFFSLEPPSSAVESVRQAIVVNKLEFCAKAIWEWCKLFEGSKHFRKS